PYRLRSCLSTLSLHDALPIFGFELEPVTDFLDGLGHGSLQFLGEGSGLRPQLGQFAFSFGNRLFAFSQLFVGGLSLELDLFLQRDRKSTRLNSSHGSISYAVF